MSRFLLTTHAQDQIKVAIANGGDTEHVVLEVPLYYVWYTGEHHYRCEHRVYGISARAHAGAHHMVGREGEILEYGHLGECVQRLCGFGSYANRGIDQCMFILPPLLNIAELMRRKDQLLLHTLTGFRRLDEMIELHYEYAGRGGIRFSQLPSLLAAVPWTRTPSWLECRTRRVGSRRAASARDAHKDTSSPHKCGREWLLRWGRPSGSPRWFLLVAKHSAHGRRLSLSACKLSKCLTMSRLPRIAI